MYYFCTYFDSNYLDKGLALYHSLCSWNQPFTLWILCLDDIVYTNLIEMQLPFVTPIALSIFEWEDPELLKAKRNRTLIEYYFTITPVLISKILEDNPSIDILTYLDADLYFYAPIKPVYEELKHGSVLIVKHNFSKSIEYLEKYGKYNVGLVSFRRNKNGLTCLNWWKERCLEWCYDWLDDDKFADQKYLDDWPERFAGVIVCQNNGVGVAPWNLEDYAGQPIIMYHFHGVKRLSKRIWDIDVSEYTDKKVSGKLVKDIYLPYLEELTKTAVPHAQIRKAPKIKNYLKKLFYGDYLLV